jgi:hypothetical protein
MCLLRLNHRDHKYKIESLLYKTADFHGTGPLGLILALQPYKFESLSSLVPMPMVTVWFGNL